MSALITAVISNYNYGRYLRAAIESVLGQTYPAIETIVVDDGSSDNSLAIAAEFADRIRVVRQDNQGVSAARNAGIAASRGEWVAFLDADDRWVPDKLEKQAAYTTDPNVGMVYCGVRLVDTTGRVIGTEVGTPHPESDLLSWLVTYRGSCGGGSVSLIRKGCLAEIGGFDEHLSTAADLDMWIRIACRYDLRCVAEPLVEYRQHANAMHLNLDVMERDNGRILAKVYSNPLCSRVHHLKRESYGRLHMMLAGSHLWQRNWTDALGHACRALWYRPKSLGYMLILPLRRMQSRRAAALQK